MGRIAKLKRELILEANKRLLGEDRLGLEPVIDGSDKRAFAVGFEEGKDTISDDLIEMGAIYLSKMLKKSLPTIEDYIEKGNLPKFITIGAGTSSTGSRDRNAQLGNNRINALKNIVFKAFDILGKKTGKYVAKDVIEKLITSSTNTSYKPSRLDPIYDRDKSKPLDFEREGFIEIRPLTTMGLDKKEIGSVGDKMRGADYLGHEDEESIVNAIKELETYSDIVDLDYELRNNGGLEGFINKTITDGLTIMGSDIEERKDIVNAINNAASNSGKGKIANIVGDKISIILQ